ncbi:winged helix-turn-helix domain-containing protein [Halobellus limi]|jgi:DNA-binding HxlR family transcriptional regulator|uniref:ArsR family transcriptional regulator n=1 Tax=Halobellus limi TaxID=699433 RepID=A0A4D6H6M7_9EURY|nr:helix-turn-helix domain-containing protein [Halobellus limi]QCC49473.1 ArsR family transcriptional regulator [Halobellus limi]
MSNDLATQREELFPLEIRQAIDALSQKHGKAVIATLLEEGPQSFTELKQRLDLTSSQTTNALDALTVAGLVRKRTAVGDDGPYDSYYTVSEFGSRFVHHLLESLGSVDSFDGQRDQFEPVDNYQDKETGEEPVVESYHRRQPATHRRARDSPTQ